MDEQNPCFGTIYKTPQYYQYCEHRLPCGYCRYLDKACPLLNNTIYPPYSPIVYTNNSGGTNT